MQYGRFRYLLITTLLTGNFEKISIRLSDCEQDSFGGRILNRYYYLALIVLLFGLSASCWLGYQMIGAKVDNNGLFVEMGALMPIA